MAETADAVVVGGGVVGSSVAYHLAEAGLRRVVVLEGAERQGTGSTGRAMGGARAQFASPAHVRMSLWSLDVFAAFEELTGVPAGFRPNGYLMLAARPEQLERLREARELQRAAGLLDVEILSAAEVCDRLPLLAPERVAGGAFRQGDAFVDPLALVSGFTRAALRRGARLRLSAPATGIRVEGGRVAGVEVRGEAISTPVVVNAAGPWAAAVAALAGVDLPVRPLRRQIAGTGPLADLPPDLPMVIDLEDGFHFRPDFRVGPPPGARLGAADPVDVSAFRTDFEPAFAEAVRARAARTAPLLGAAVIDPARCGAGLYAMSPDHHAILGESPEVAGLFFANGFSGHGVMHSPATGRILAELVTAGHSATFPEAADFGPGRFTSGRLLHEPAVY